MTCFPCPRRHDVLFPKRAPAATTWPPRPRAGKALVLLAIAVPMVFGMLGLVVDGGVLTAQHRALQQVADMAAAAAARDLALGASSGEATATAVTVVRELNALPDADVVVNVPPAAGPYAGNSRYVEVLVSRNVATHFIQVLRGESSQFVRARAVAGVEASTAGGAIAVLDPQATPVTLTGLPLSLPLLPPPHLAGLEVLGVGALRVDGAVFVNSEWGGVDEDGNPAGENAGPPWGMACTPLLPLTKLQATDIRVVGGVDDPENYGAFDADEPNPLRANRLPVPDPLRHLPVPTYAADPLNVFGDERGTVSIVSLPLLAPPVRLEPGVYEWIQIVSGRVIFDPGVYIIRGVHPVTGISLNITAGQVTGDGVMFYVTDTTDYTPATGVPDASDGETVPPAAGAPSVIPSVVLNAGLLGTRLSGVDDASSPFDGVLLYQRRMSRRPILIVAEPLLGGAGLSGTIYAKWGQLEFVGHGTYDLGFAVGTGRIINVLQCTFAPSRLFPPAEDVFVVE